MAKAVSTIISFLSLTILASCEPINFQDVQRNIKDKIHLKDLIAKPDLVISTKSISDMVERSNQSINVNDGFSAAIRAAVISDSSIRSLKDELEARSATVKIYQSQKDFQVTGDILAGIEDITDKTSGAAVVLKANRLLFDGGKLEAEILREQLSLESARYALLARMDQRSLELAGLWVDLDRYDQLNNLIDSRLSVLDPLIRQLDEVAKAGIGDVSQVAAAQRTVSSVRVTKANISEKLLSSKLGFENAFGAIPDNIVYDAKGVSGLVPSKISDELAFESPALQSEFLNYRSSEANLIAVRLKDSHNIGFEARASRPMGDSEYDSDESIGIVLRKKLFNGNVFDLEVQQAQALVNSAAAKLEATYKEGERVIKISQQKIVSLQKAIELARENAAITSDEITYLKQQLIIGGSTLDSVLSAEARLYEAESQEINLKAELHKAQLTILSSLGILSSSVGLGL